jgi:hypothetical protein
MMGTLSHHTQSGKKKFEALRQLTITFTACYQPAEKVGVALDFGWRSGSPLR